MYMETCLPVGAKATNGKKVAHVRKASTALLAEANNISADVAFVGMMNGMRQDDIGRVASRT